MPKRFVQNLLQFWFIFQHNGWICYIFFRGLPLFCIFIRVWLRLIDIWCHQLFWEFIHSSINRLWHSLNHFFLCISNIRPWWRWVNPLSDQGLICNTFLLKVTCRVFNSTNLTSSGLGILFGTCTSRLKAIPMLICILSSEWIPSLLRSFSSSSNPSILLYNINSNQTNLKVTLRFNKSIKICKFKVY